MTSFSVADHFKKESPEGKKRSAGFLRERVDYPESYNGKAFDRRVLANRFSEFLPGCDIYKTDDGELLRLVLLRLVEIAKEDWLINGTFHLERDEPIRYPDGTVYSEKTPVWSDALIYRLDLNFFGLAKVVYPKIGFIFVDQFEKALAEIGRDQEFDWEAFLWNFDKIPLDIACAIFLVETEIAIWVRRVKRNPRAEMLKQIKRGLIRLSDNTLEKISPNQQKILSVYYNSEKPMHYLEAACRAELPNISPDNWAKIQKWKREHPKEAKAYKIPQLFNGKSKLQRFLLRSPKRGIYEATF